MKTHYSAIISGLLILGSASCGGGGGSSTSSGSTQSGVSQVVLEAIIEASVVTIDEGQSVTLDASSSTPSSPSFSWIQTSGPEVIINTPNAPSITFKVPELTEAARGVFEVTVVSAGVSYTDTISIDFENIFQLPRASFTLDEVSTLSTQTGVRAGFPINTTAFVLLQNDPESSSGNEDKVLRVDNSFYDAPNFVDQLTEVDVDSTPIGQSGFLVNSIGAAHAAPGFPFYAVEEQNDEVIYSTRYFNSETQKQTYEENYRYAVDAPCALTPVLNINPAVIPSSQGRIESGYILGQNGGGLSVVIPAGNLSQVSSSVVLQQIESSKNYCALAFLGGRDNALNGDVLAIDVAGLTADLFTDTQSSPDDDSADINYTLAQSITLDLDANLNLEFIAASTSQGSIAALFSDREHVGQHFVVTISLDETGSVEPQIVQSVHSWTRGVPSQAIWGIADKTGDKKQLLILSESSPEAVIFSESSAGSMPFDFEGPSFVEVGLGAGSGFVSIDPDYSNSGGSGIADGFMQGYIIAYPELGLLRDLDVEW